MEDDEGKKLITEIREYKLELGKARDRKITAEGRIEELVGQIREREEDVGKGEKELGRFRRDLEKQEKKLERNSKQYENVNSEFEELAGNMQDSSERFYKLQKTIQKGKRKLEELQGGCHSLYMEREALEERIKRSVSNLGSVEESVSNLELEINETEWKIKDRRKLIKDGEKRKKKLEKKAANIRREMLGLKGVEKELGDKIARLNQDYQRLSVRRRMAEESGYGLAVKKILEASNKGKLKGIYGTIAQLAQVDDDYEIALSTAAGGGMQAVVTKDDSCAAKAIQFLKSNNLGRAAFLPLNRMRGGERGGNR